MKRLLQYIFTYFFISFLWVISFLPRFIQKKIAILYSLFLYLVLPSRRQIIDNNIAIAYPKFTKEERRKLLIKNYKSLGYSLIEMANAWFWSNKKLKSSSIVKGMKFISDAKKNNQGTIIIMPHYNNLELIGTMLSCHTPVNIAFSTPKNQVFADFLDNRRNRFIKKTLVSRQFKQLITQLKKSESLLYGPDQSKCEKNAPTVPFFSKKVKTTAGTYKLAKLSKAQIIVINSYYDIKVEKYIIDLSAPLEISNLDLIESTTLVNQAIENVVYQNPEQYMWIHKRFK